MAFSPVSDLRIVLLGKNTTENSSVGNFILGRSAFESEAPSADVELHIEREKGKLQDREVTVVNDSQLLIPDLFSSQITQTVKEIVNLSAPGPHVIILILQQNHFTEEDRRRVKYVLNEFSDEAIKHTIVLTEEEDINNDCIHQLIQECGGGHLQFDQQKSECQSEILKRIKKILKDEEVEFLICDMYEETRETSADEEQSRSEGSVTTEEENFYLEDCDLEDFGHFKQSNKEKLDIAVQGSILLPEAVCVLAKLNVVLCGRDRGLKSSISRLMLDQRDKESELSSECVKLDGEVDGRLITLVELPALTLLSQKEEMRQSLRCVSLCDPGVHVFLFVIPDGPLTDEDKTETEKFQKIFSSEIKNHIMVLIIQKSEHRTKGPNEAMKAVIECFGGRHHYLELNTQVSMLVTKLEQMVEENDRRFISTEAFLEAQMEKFEETRKKLISLETQIQQKGND
nr:GTPase IMAP family member 8-like [Danio rerio]|eukprot:XP_021325763.1 GTPase IMAP family member 8-like [Danio rerio]